MRKTLEDSSIYRLPRKGSKKYRPLQLLRYHKKNLAFALTNENENWMRDKLAALTGYYWHRQFLLEFPGATRFFDFYSPLLKVAVEVDGPEHSPRGEEWAEHTVRNYDHKRDELTRFIGIKVLRVRNQNEEDAAKVLRQIKTLIEMDEASKHLSERGLVVNKRKFKDHLVRGPQSLENERIRAFAKENGISLRGAARGLRRLAKKGIIP